MKQRIWNFYDVDGTQENGKVTCNEEDIMVNLLLMMRVRAWTVERIVIVNKLSNLILENGWNVVSLFPISAQKF